MLDWLWHARSLVHPIEYVLIWATFVAINGLGLEYGMLAGVGFAILVFIFEYGRSPKTHDVRAASHVARHPRDTKVLSESRDHIITALRLSGYIFFGSAVGIVKDIYRRLEPDALPETSLGLQVSDTEGLSGQPAPASEVPPRHRRQQYLVLDFSQVSGIDATAARSCFIRLKQLSDERGVIMILCNMKDRIYRLLKNHGVIPVKMTKTSRFLSIQSTVAHSLSTYRS